jgi:uncharacterized membrane protein YdfJ with MMPL/SSD domain
VNRALASLASWVARNRRAVLGVWIALLVAGGYFSAHQADRLSGGGWDVPGSQSLKASQELKNFPAYHGSRIAVFIDASSPVAARAAVARVNVATERDSKLHPNGPPQRFRGGSAVLIPYLFTGHDDIDFADHLRKTVVSDAGGAKTRVLGDGAIWSDFQTIAKKQLAEGEGTGFPLVLIVLLLAFGTVVAALAPLLLAFFAVFLTGAVIYLLSGVYEMSIYVTNMASMIGIGVAVDYSLFVVSHYRADFARTGDREASLREALSSAGTAVVFSGATVVVSLAGLFIVPVNAVRSMAIGAIVVVSIAVLGTITLLPAMLALAGHRIERLRVPVGKRFDVEGSDAFWHRWSSRVMRRPVLFFSLGAAFLIVVALPTLSLSTQIRNLDQLPRDSEVRAATEKAAQLAGPGFLGPIQLIVNDRSAAQAIHDSVARVKDVASVTQPVRSQGGGSYLVEAVPAVDTQNAAGRRVHAQVSAAAHRAVGDRDVALVIGGVTAHNKDAARALAGGLWKIILFIIAISYLVLFLLLRSVLLPLKAVVMNLLSVGAAYGVLVAVFQWGWVDWTGYHSPGYLDSIVPTLVLAVTFGLSMDYEVFLLTRIREFYATGIGNERAVGEGLAASARVITAAALIMVGVFGAFAIFGAPSLKETGVGLAVAIFVDATITRLVIVPATMRLLGDWNWWLPRPLERLLNRAHVPAAETSPS